MRRLIRSILHTPTEYKKLSLCQAHLKRDQNNRPIINIKQPIPYSSDHCTTCQEYLCHVCSQEHVIKNCVLQFNTLKHYGTGVLNLFNYGHLIKLTLHDLKCICGKPLSGDRSAICAACGMGSCSQECHQEWQKAGNCKFRQLFYSIPDGFSIRSILFDNIKKIHQSDIKQWYIANKSNTTMVSAYASSLHPSHIYLQRGYRIYGQPNEQLIRNMQAQVPATLDYYIHFDRLCECSCQNCRVHPGHSCTNCQSSCKHFDYQFMKKANLQPKFHRQCTCPCDFCKSGLIFHTHRFIDCMPFCTRSSLHRNDR